MLTKPKALAAININFDSLAAVLGFPSDYKDPSFGPVLDRFLGFSDEYGFKFSIFVVGRDLENRENFARVRALSEAGHEIGNHSWSHPFDLGSRGRAGTRDEIVKAHEIITRCIGREPRGFISPVWNWSDEVLDCLTELKYLYDSSFLPSPFLYPMVVRLLWSYRTSPLRALRILSRRDWACALAGKRDAHLLDRANVDRPLVQLPLPTTGNGIWPVWHTTGFMFGWSRHFDNLQDALNARSHFYYLCHPADLLCPEDIVDWQGPALPRLDQSLEGKLENFRTALTRISRHKQLVTMEKLAEDVLAKQR